MVNNADNVRLAITGTIWWDGTQTATAPTSVTSAITGMNDLGYVSEEGVTLTPPGAGDSTPIKAWQNSATVRILRAPSEDVPTIQFSLIETKLETIEAAFGVTVTQTATDGSFVINSNEVRDPALLVLDVIDGDEAFRLYVPRGVVTELAEISFTGTDPIGYNMTVACEFDQTLNGNIKVWSTALKSAE